MSFVERSILGGSTIGGSTIGSSTVLCLPVVCTLINRYCIGELDKESKTLTLHKTELFSLKPYIPGRF